MIGGHISRRTTRATREHCDSGIVSEYLKTFLEEVIRTFKFSTNNYLGKTPKNVKKSESLRSLP